MNATKIEWVKNPDGTPGYSWNPITGCLNHVNGMCKGGNFPCYAYRRAHGRLKNVYLGNKMLAPYESPFSTGIGYDLRKIPDCNPFYPRFWEDKLGEIYQRWQKRNRRTLNPIGVFACDMSDLFGIGIPEDWTRQVLSAISQYSNENDRFYLLTKQPQNLAKFQFPDNCWVGVTATDRFSLEMAIRNLKRVETNIKYISFEPLLERPFTDTHLDYGKYMQLSGINWLIIGACTGTFTEMFLLGQSLGMVEPRERITPLGKGKYALQPKIECVREIVQAADKAGVKVFLKDSLFHLIIQAAYRGEVDEKYVFEGKLRQEIPK